MAKITDLMKMCIRDSNKGEDGGEDQYGLITSPFYSTIDWYSKKDYDKIMNEVKRIVKESKITDDMIDEEKAYRIGRYMVKHLSLIHIFSTLSCIPLSSYRKKLYFP